MSGFGAWAAGACFILVRPAEGIERKSNGDEQDGQQLASSWYDPQRVLKVVDIQPSQLVCRRASSWYDPQRVLKGARRARVLGRMIASSWYDPQRVLKVLIEARRASASHASSWYDPQRVLKAQRIIDKEQAG